MNRIILHSDMNSFYASVECFYNPSIRDKPVAVAGDPEARHGIILAKNQLAKTHGVKTGEAIWEAKAKSPDLVVMPPQYKLYQEYSQKARRIYNDYSPNVEHFGLDEAWIDLTGYACDIAEGERMANDIRHRITEELGVTASVGVSFNKVFAKLGSDLKKPDATTVISEEDYRDKVWPLPAAELLYVGRATQQKLTNYGIMTIGDLAQSDAKWLEARLGKWGIMLWRFANGLESQRVAEFEASSPIKSMGNSTTTPRDLLTPEDVYITTMILSESVAARLREGGFRCRTVQVSIRGKDLMSYERQAKLPYHACDSDTIGEAAMSLYRRHHLSTGGAPIRSLGVRACDLVPAKDVQLSLLPEVIHAHARERIEETIDQLRGRYGHFCIQRGVMLTDKQLSHLNPKGDHTIHPIGYFSDGSII